MNARWLVLALLFPALACHSAGPYGHAQIYAPLGPESDAIEHAREYDPVMAERAPEQWKGKPVSVFGVVLARSEGSGGVADAKLSVRSLEPRNLCENADEDSCRVTVSDKEHAIIHARVQLRAEDDIGEHGVGPRSLVRVVGVITDDVDAADGAPVLRATYYRHWPRDFYVTTAARSYMLR